ncbi:hypothetical protein C2G38_2304981 [Gigaspora rosea]|uniref:Uncharacterized protein n=1 Tax=Gigaspora rosea TaxID=44941 RepID=A0A397VCG0_9GLOM|nr:hypothetical protein C2G38_2304981 [Gigaspora rosea]
MVAQMNNTEASTSYASNSKVGTSYAVNAEVSYVSNSKTGTSYVLNTEVSTPCTVIFEQAANIESSTSYAEASTSGVFNAEFGPFYMVNVQTNTSYTIDFETNTFCKNAVYDNATTKKVDNIDISNTIYEIMVVIHRISFNVLRLPTHFYIRHTTIFYY